MTKSLMDKPRGIVFDGAHTVGTTIFMFPWWLNLTDLYLNIVQIVLILVGLYPRTTLRVNKFIMFKRFRCILLKRNIISEGTWLYDVGRVTCTIINWPHWTGYIMGQFGKWHKIILITWACPIFHCPILQWTWLGQTYKRVTFNLGLQHFLLRLYEKTQ